MIEEQIAAYVRALGEYVDYMASVEFSVKAAFELRQVVIRSLNALPAREQILAGQRTHDVFSGHRPQAVRERILKNEHAVELYIQKHELWD